MLSKSLIVNTTGLLLYVAPNGDLFIVTGADKYGHFLMIPLPKK